MRNATPTGRWRHRVHRGKLILQLEERGSRTYMLGHYVETDLVTRWRDARPEDVTVSDAPAQPPGAEPE